jgi:hypothetical protein
MGVEGPQERRLAEGRRMRTVVLALVRESQSTSSQHTQECHYAVGHCVELVLCFVKKTPPSASGHRRGCNIATALYVQTVRHDGFSSGGRHDWQPMVVAARPPLIFSLSSWCRLPADGVTGVVAGVAMTGTTWRSLHGRWRSLRRWCPCDPCSARRLHFS